MSPKTFIIILCVFNTSLADDPLGLKRLGSLVRSAKQFLIDNAVTRAVGSVAGSIGRSVQKEVVTALAPLSKTVSEVGSLHCAHVVKIYENVYNLVAELEPNLDLLSLEYQDPLKRTSYRISGAASKIPVAPEFSPQHMYILVHGFADYPFSGTFVNISDALMKRGISNILELDGSSLIHWRSLYLRSNTYVQYMGEKLGAVLAALVYKGLSPSAIHIIGHSLGAHIAGFTGKTFFNLTGSKVGRISGLDPAGPCFSHVSSDLRLNASDAEFVDVIHTDAGVYGLRDPVGHVDYYPNNGGEQPNCLLRVCSHSRAWAYYAESVQRPRAFLSKRCNDYQAFQRNDCDDISYMGFSADPNSRGKFYLQTGEDSPFGLGPKGAVYENRDGVLKSISSTIFW